MPITLDDIKQQEIDELKGQRQRFIDRVRDFQLKIRKVNKRIYRLENGKPDIEISRHAIKRYQQRVENISFESIRDKLLGNEVLIERIENFGDGKYHAGNCIVVVKSDTIVTVLNFINN